MVFVVVVFNLIDKNLHIVSTLMTGGFGKWFFMGLAAVTHSGKENCGINKSVT